MNDIGVGKKEAGSASTSPITNGDKKTPLKIDNDGDLMLVCGDLNEHTFLVSARALSTCSPVFRATLVEFEESEGIAMRKMYCTDDKPESMLALCCLLHNVPRPTAVKGSRDNVAAFLDLAVLIHKYQCTSALSLQIEDMLCRYMNRRMTRHFSMETMADLAAIAYLLEKADYFYIFTKSLVLDYVTPFSTLGRQSSGRALGYPVLLLLEEQRNAARLKVQDSLHSFATFTCPAARCGAVKTSTQLLYAVSTQIPNAARQWPLAFATTSIRAVLEAINGLTTIDTKIQRVCDHGEVNGEMAASVFQDYASKSNERLAGLCLQCTKEGEETLLMCKENHFMVRVGMEDDL